MNLFPFTAVVGMEDAKRALECALVSPCIRTVLIRGGEGSAKTTLARAAAGISGRKVVNCPLNVTDEQLFASANWSLAYGDPRAVPFAKLLTPGVR